MKTIYNGATPTFLFSIPELGKLIGVGYQQVHRRIAERTLPAPTHAYKARKYYTEDEIRVIVANERRTVETLT